MATPQIHCMRDGWGWLGTCPHCLPGCPCGKRCNGPYMTGLDASGQPTWGPTPELLTVADDEGDE